MIRTNKEILYDVRSQKTGIVHVKMEYPELIQNMGKYLIHVIDYVLEDDMEKIISVKNVQIQATVFDALQEQIITSLNITGTSIEKTTKAMPYALLEYVKNDIVDSNNNTLIYGTVAADWELIPT